MNYYQKYGEIPPPSDLDYPSRSPDRFEESWNLCAGVHNSSYYHNQLLEIDPTEQLLDRVSGISVHVWNSSPFDVLPHPRVEPYVPRSAGEYYKQGFRSADLYQESFPTQPYPRTSQTTTLRHRQPSPIDTIASSSSGFDCISSYSRDSIASDLDSNGSPLPFSPEECAFNQAGINDIISYNGDPFCTLREIQNISDEDHEPSVPRINDHDFLNPDIAFKEECAYPTPLSQSSYDEKLLIEESKYSFQPRRPDNEWTGDDDEKDSDYTPSPTKSRRSAHSSSKQKQAGASTRSKVAKRLSSKTRQSRSALGKGRIQESVNSLRIESDARARTSPFSCPLTPYGCKSTFKSKNEWKRHIVSRHLFLGFWRCDYCPEGDTRPNDFNRKDLFTEHLRRMHHPKKEFVATAAGKTSSKNKKQTSKANNRKEGSDEPIDPLSEKFENSLEETRERCWKHIRDSPNKAYCAFCDKIFDGQRCFEEWLEHVGQHLSGFSRQSRGNTQDGDSGWDSRKWMKDTVLRDWLVDRGFLVKDPDDGQFRLVDDETAHEINMQQMQKNEAP